MVQPHRAARDPMPFPEKAWRSRKNTGRRYCNTAFLSHPHIQWSRLHHGQAVRSLCLFSTPLHHQGKTSNEFPVPKSHPHKYPGDTASSSSICAFRVACKLGIYYRPHIQRGAQLSERMKPESSGIGFADYYSYNCFLMHWFTDYSWSLLQFFQFTEPGCQIRYQHR